MSTLSERLRRTAYKVDSDTATDALHDAADALDEAERLLERWVLATYPRESEHGQLHVDTRRLLARLKGGA